MSFKFNKLEIEKLDDYWNFIDTFNKNMVEDNVMYSSHEYRNTIIKIIKKKYKIEEFYFYEQILNKMLWNLLEKYEIKLRDINYSYPPAYILKSGSTINKKRIKYNKTDDITFPLYQHIHTREETPKNLNKIFHALRYRELYEKLIEDKEYIKKIKPILYYYPHDYLFPNINLLYFNYNEKATWIKRIKAYYYSKDDSKWYKLLDN